MIVTGYLKNNWRMDSIDHILVMKFPIVVNFSMLLIELDIIVSHFNLLTQYYSHLYIDKR